MWPLILTMMVIIWFTSGGNFFNGGMCACFTLLFLLFFFAGPGRWSLDYVLFERGKKIRSQELD
ncbi:hypothetical protein AM493_14825 [Flavobacterium akiainvivens]|uniref:Uncharacterized protein n=1 Tax=Flavobacterium akiainvivens TaxID=1202724 RepID=A0A0M8MAR3_9FLAO|nr:hypothetical protein [Flavobacterium akiainvivens]KOS07173.1 hypothetical protein AM493_14825 [Flavobacterium akiainvivens]